MAKRLFVGSLPYDTTNNQLEELFSQVGPVESINLVTDKYTGQSKGFAFVEMVNEADAQTAIQKFNGFSMGSRTIVVNEARPREERPMGDRGPRRDFRRDDRRGGGGGGFNRGPKRW
jgi:cold-inducible RNA-binding protein